MKTVYLIFPTRFLIGKWTKIIVTIYLPAFEKACFLSVRMNSVEKYEELVDYMTWGNTDIKEH